MRRQSYYCNVCDESLGSISQVLEDDWEPMGVGLVYSQDGFSVQHVVASEMHICFTCVRSIKKLDMDRGPLTRPFDVGPPKDQRDK